MAVEESAGIGVGARVLRTVSDADAGTGAVFALAGAGVSITSGIPGGETPLGLRTLAPDETGYIAHYEGEPPARDGAYHQGTVWPWLMGPFVDAWVRVRGNTEAARRAARQRFLSPLLAHLESAGLGHVSEIADAEPPFTPRGCPFQGWSLGELIRLDREILTGRAPASAAMARTPRP